MGLFKALILTAFVIITIIGWLVQFINSQNHPPPPARRRRDNNEQGGGKVRNEIEQFLEEARRSRQGLPPKDAMAGGIEVVEPPRRPPAEQKAREEVWREQTQGRRQPAQQQAPRPQQQQRKQPKKQPKQPVVQQPKTLVAKPAETKSALPLRASTQTEVARHVQQQMAERIGQGVAAHLPNSVGSNVEAHLGRFSANADDSFGSQGLRETMSRRSGQDADLRQLLRSKQGIRSAILINEILGPPLSRRPRT